MLTRGGRTGHHQRAGTVDTERGRELIGPVNVVGNLCGIPLHGPGDMDLRRRDAELSEPRGVLLVLDRYECHLAEQPADQGANPAIATEAAPTEPAVDHTNPDAAPRAGTDEVRPELQFKAGDDVRPDRLEESLDGSRKVKGIANDMEAAAIEAGRAGEARVGRGGNDDLLRTDRFGEAIQQPLNRVDLSH